MSKYNQSVLSFVLWPNDIQFGLLDLCNAWNILVIFAPKVTEVCALIDSVASFNLHIEIITQNYLSNFDSSALKVSQYILDDSVLIWSYLVLWSIQNGDEALPFTIFAFGCEICFWMLLICFFFLGKSDSHFFGEKRRAPRTLDLGKKDGLGWYFNGWDILSPSEQDETEYRHGYTYKIIKDLVEINSYFYGSFTGRQTEDN